jgi:3-oxoacyl-[acyl-carrier-protein] synthase-3
MLREVSRGSSQFLRKVHVLGTGSFLPGPPVTIDEIDARLGGLDDAPEAVRRFSAGAGRRLAEHAGVRHRHFAIDPGTGELTHDFAGLAREACVLALAQAAVAPDEVDLLVVSMPGVDDFTPPTSATLQAELGIERCAEIAVHSNCSGVGKAVQIAMDAIRVGRCRTALVAYSQLSSIFLRSAWLSQPAMTRSQALMRWILSDGSGAMVLRAADDPEAPGHELVEAHAMSIGGTLPPAMTCGLGARLMRTQRVGLADLVAQGLHHLDQDFGTVSEFSAARLEALLLDFANVLDLKHDDIHHYVLSIPTVKLYEDARKRIDYLDWDRCPFRCATSGYCGGASILVHLDEMARGGALRPGELAMCYSVESSKWMGGGFLVRW